MLQCELVAACGCGDPAPVSDISRIKAAAGGGGGGGGAGCALAG